MRSLLIALSFATAAACGSGAGVDPGVDGGDGDGDGDRDGGELTAGLRLEIDTLPEVTGTWNNDFMPELDDVELILEDLRIVGDAGGDRTRLDQVTLAWTSPVTVVIEFADAPIGFYSRIRADIDDFDFEGSFELDSDTEDWEIEDTPSGVSIDLPIAVDLEPGEIETIKLEVDIRPMFDAIDWTMVEPDDDGDYVVDNDHPSIDDIYALLVANITVVEDGNTE